MACATWFAPPGGLFDALQVQRLGQFALVVVEQRLAVSKDRLQPLLLPSEASIEARHNDRRKHGTPTLAELLGWSGRTAARKVVCERLGQVWEAGAPGLPEDRPSRRG
eukprot:6305021-Alexandrium_andersonii.AAC.1